MNIELKYPDNKKIVLTVRSGLAAGTCTAWQKVGKIYLRYCKPFDLTPFNRQEMCFYLPANGGACVK
jgi:hypothetical protein